MKKLLFSLFFILTLSAGYAHAQTQTASQFCQNGSCTYVSLEPLPGLPDCYGPNPPSSCKNPGGSFANLVGNSFKLLIGAGGMIAVVMIVIGALTYMFSDVVGNKTKALARIRNAMWAIVILVSSFLILNTINPELVTFSLNLSSAGNTGSFANTPANTTVPIAPTNTVTTGTVNSSVQQAVCGSSGPCSTTANYIVFDPNANEVQAQVDRNNFISTCETTHYDSQTNTDRIGKVSLFPASLVGGGSLTGAACVLQ